MVGGLKRWQTQSPRVQLAGGKDFVEDFEAKHRRNRCTNQFVRLSQNEGVNMCVCVSFTYKALGPQEVSGL